MNPNPLNMPVFSPNQTEAFKVEVMVFQLILTVMSTANAKELWE